MRVAGACTSLLIKLAFKEGSKLWDGVEVRFLSVNLTESFKF